MLATLSTYFEPRQNIMTAADALAVHHNSLPPVEDRVRPRPEPA